MNFGLNIKRSISEDKNKTTCLQLFFSPGCKISIYTVLNVQWLKEEKVFSEFYTLVFFFFFFTRTELLECYGDQDFLAKLHCVRQAFQVCPSSHNLPILPNLSSLFISGLPEVGPVYQSWPAIGFKLAHQMPLKKEKVKRIVIMCMLFYLL